MPHYLHLLGLVFLISPLLISASKIDNKILGLPVVQCVNGAITFNFETEKPFAGRAYVRGLEDDANCTQRFSQSNSSLTNQTRFSLSVKRGQCNMDRQRTPEGVAHSVMVIVAFHPVFETKNDIAFRGVCFFRTAMKIAGSLHGVAGSMSVVVENNGRPPSKFLESKVPGTSMHPLCHFSPTIHSRLHLHDPRSHCRRSKRSLRSGGRYAPSCLGVLDRPKAKTAI